ncbi:hypothetical protein OS493_020234 [Desmophyllum pertusum]|uniref:Uncharacterized protein n=1 Tax=Desmophyllum pertusum TaxID=174260 RepID=A0A9W9ZRH1_9CNID|nr:hypothetical protein OS493_020234 [Desmophyllum pertusum]
MKGYIRSIGARRNMRCTKAGAVVELRLSYKWGSETIDLEDFVTLADPTARDARVPDLEITAEMSQLTIRNEYPAVPTTSDSTVGNYNSSSSFVMDSSDAELRQRPGETGHCAKNSHKNHKHSIHNPNACLRKEIPLKRITHSKMICKPITLAMSAPTADGSAAAVVCSREFMESNGMQNKAVEIIAQQIVTDLPSSFDHSFLDLAGVAMAVKLPQTATDQLVSLLVLTYLKSMTVSLAMSYSCMKP